MNQHLSAPELVDYHYGGLDDSSSASVEGHLANCSSCRSLSVAVERERSAVRKAAVASGQAQRSLSPSDAPRLGRLRAAWRFFRSRALAATLVLIALGLGTALASATRSRFQQLQDDAAARDRALNDQIAEMRKAADQQARTLAQTQSDWRAGVKKAQEELSQTLALLQTDVIRQKERIARSITIVQENLEREVARLKALQSDSSRQNEEKRLALEKEFGNEKERLEETLKARQHELEDLTARLEELKQRAEAAEKRIPEPLSPPKVLALGFDDTVALAWDPPKYADASALTLRGSSVGWAAQSGQVGDGTQAYSGVAAVNGRVFVGNGFSANKILAYSSSGKLLWQHQMNDPGAGTPVLSEDGETVYFASESCTLYAVATASGTRRWSRVVGPTALTQPTVTGKNSVLVVSRTSDSGRAGGLPYSLSALRAQDGNFLWIQGLQTDALSAPIVDGGKAYVATRDGLLNVFDVANGKLVGSYNNRITSAPWIAGNSMYFTSWNSSAKTGFEESFISLAADGSTKPQTLAGPFAATYLVPPVTDARPDVVDGPDPTPSSGSASDPEEKALRQAVTRAGLQPTLSHEWSYMGARPTVIGDDAFLAVGDQVMSWDLRQGRAKWSLRIAGRADRILSIGQGQPPLTPPAFAGGKLYFGSLWGDVICMDAGTGAVLWRLRLPNSQGIASQVILDRGNVYATTRKGLLISIDARDPMATGWSDWGGGPGHNGPVAPPPQKRK